MQEIILQGSGLDNLMNQQEVAEVLGVSTKTLESWRCRKTGPEYFKLGRLARYRWSDVMIFIQRLIDKEVSTVPKK